MDLPTPNKYSIYKEFTSCIGKQSWWKGGIGNYPQPSLWQEDHLLNAQQTSAAAAAPSLSLHNKRNNIYGEERGEGLIVYSLIIYLNVGAKKEKGASHLRWCSCCISIYFKVMKKKGKKREIHFLFSLYYVVWIGNDDDQGEEKEKKRKNWWAVEVVQSGPNPIYVASSCVRDTNSLSNISTVYIVI